MKRESSVAESGAGYFVRSVRDGVNSPNSYVTLLGLQPQETRSLINLVQQGFSFREVESLRGNLRLSPDEFSSLVQITPRTLSRRKEHSRLLPDESDRILRASRIFGRTLELFEGDEDGARRWLREPQEALGSSTPLNLAATDIGAQMVEDLIGRLEHGVFS